MSTIPAEYPPRHRPSDYVIAPEAGEDEYIEVGVLFVGAHERQLDDKGRLALPSAFRSRFEPRCFLARGQDGCIDVMTEEGFDDMVTELLEEVRRGLIITRETQERARRNGRVRTPEELAAELGLDDA